MRGLRSGLLIALGVGLASPAAAAVKPGLEGAQDLFRRNHWEEARTHLRAQWGSIPEANRAAATFLIGRSYVREAEFFGALRQVGVEIGLDYFRELARQRANRNVALLPAFIAFYELEAGDAAAAARDLAAAAALPGLAPEWKASARLRRGVALQRTGRGAPAPVSPQAGIEARFWRMLGQGIADASPMTPATPRERAMAAALLFRGSRAAAAEQQLRGLERDVPDAEDRSDPKKVLRFHDPLVATAWERICWERAAIALRPQAVASGGPEQALAAYYTGLAYLQLGALDEAARFLKQASASLLPPPLAASAKVLLAACSWRGRAPAPSELLQLWESTQAQPDTVLVWDDLRRAPFAPRGEPFTGRLDRREQELLQGLPERPSGALVGRWALARLRHGGDVGALVSALAEYRDDSNKNKIDWNDPLLLLALAAANHRNQQYAQSLETLFEVSKSFPGLRWVQWNLQGVYAARQKAGGETRISQ